MDTNAKDNRLHERTQSFPANKYEALEEIQEMLGFTDAELTVLFDLLEKANGGYIEFKRGDVEIEFHTFAFHETSANEVSLRLRAKEKEVTHATEYQFPQGLTRRAEK